MGGGERESWSVYAAPATTGAPPGAGPPPPGLAVAIVALVMNAFVLPGTGTLLVRRRGRGVAQLLLFGMGIALLWVILGAPMIAAAWAWAIVEGIVAVSAAVRARRGMPRG